ncbi:MAG TPA: MBL fold metallo-hydrolase [Phycisphaerae bacterium]|nr:MBL fold metallo-hydrolase [Phycisphaerae bacterium]HOJ75796.1 MBL fold metallo-hydrolase [Phycisphaerae bacterium]HOM53182.1 MBL fold metallo-hydrolase [Phycisphaerae bacterium]HON68750.1 MBL fold metallo-hydrolase [Phycisphaerae bacterium]HOQ87464.1 MBL fold metallo-hydrolase [Phycisphaerae bacterium]
MASRLIEKTVGPHRLLGFSMAGEETVIILPEMNVAFDVGRAPRELINIDYVCLTHGHMDHSAGLAYYFSQRNFQGLPPGCVLAHHRLVPAIQDLMQVYGRIEGHVTPAQVIGVDEDEDVAIRRDLLVRPFRVRHSGSALGFSVIEVRKKLRPELAELSGQQIAELKRSGQEVEYRLEIPRVAFCGDSAPGDYLDHPHVRDAEVVIIECTFFEGDHIDRAYLGQHTHVNDLPGVLARLNSKYVVISHITRRTGIAEAKRRLLQVLKPADIQRVVVLMDRPPRNRRETLRPVASDEG